MMALTRILLAILLGSSPTDPPTPDVPATATPTPATTAKPVLYDTIKYVDDGQGQVNHRKTLERLGIPTFVAYHGGVDWNERRDHTG